MTTTSPPEGRPMGDYDVTDHGFTHAQYFAGHGVCLTEYEDCATGSGDSYAEALEDALDALAQGGWDVSGVSGVPDQAGEEPETDEDGNPFEEGYSYLVSVRVK